MPDGWASGASPSPDALLDALRLALKQEELGDGTAARCVLRHIAHAAPGWAEPWFRLGQSLRRAGRRQAAMEAYDKGLALESDRVQGLIARGVLALQAGDGKTARSCLRRAVRLAPSEHEAWHALALAEWRCDAVQAAGDALRQACTLAPDRVVYAFDLAELIEARPEAGPEPVWPEGVALALQGRAALRDGDVASAEPLLEAAQILLPDERLIAGTLAELCILTNRPNVAVRLLEGTRDLVQEDRAAAHNLAVAQSRCYRYAEAEQTVTSALERFGEDPSLRITRAAARACRGDFDMAFDDINIVRSLCPSSFAAERNACNLLPYREDVSAPAILDAMRALGRMLHRPEHPLCGSRRQLGEDARASNGVRPLRVGLLSNSLQAHPVGWLTLAGIQCLDADAFPVVCFGARSDGDTFANRYAERAEAWHRIEGLGPQAIAEKILEQKIDILIDLSGYGDTGVLPVLAFRPAPVQIKWVGMQSTTTGLDEVDFFLTDRWETPDGFERFYSERLLRLDDGYVCYTPPPGAVPVSSLPALDNGHVTFGCFNNVMKITDGTLSLWARIFERLPTARMLLRCPQFSETTNVERFLARAEAAGLAPARLELRGHARHPEFLATYREIDIALDPFPYTGGLTTCEALFMGVPVVTLAGETFAARHSTSHLCNVGLSDWVATSKEEYLQRAIVATEDLDGLARLREGLRAQVIASPLCDAPRFGRSLGKALLSAWVNRAGFPGADFI